MRTTLLDGAGLCRQNRFEYRFFPGSRKPAVDAQTWLLAAAGSGTEPVRPRDFWPRFDHLSSLLSLHLSSQVHPQFPPAQPSPPVPLLLSLTNHTRLPACSPSLYFLSPPLLQVRRRRDCLHAPSIPNKLTRSSLPRYSCRAP